jgi:hypothetical protein
LTKADVGCRDRPRPLLLGIRHRDMDSMNDPTDERPVAIAQTPAAQSRPDITAAYQRGDMLALEKGLRAAARLTPHRLAQFKSNIERLVARNPSISFRPFVPKEDRDALFRADAADVQNMAIRCARPTKKFCIFLSTASRME